MSAPLNGNLAENTFQFVCSFSSLHVQFPCKLCCSIFLSAIWPQCMYLGCCCCCCACTSRFYWTTSQWFDNEEEEETNISTNITQPNNAKSESRDDRVDSVNIATVCTLNTRYRLAIWITVSWRKQKRTSNNDAAADQHHILQMIFYSFGQWLAISIVFNGLHLKREVSARASKQANRRVCVCEWIFNMYASDRAIAMVS